MDQHKTPTPKFKARDQRNFASAVHRCMVQDHWAFPDRQSVIILKADLPNISPVSTYGQLGRIGVIAGVKPNSAYTFISNFAPTPRCCEQ